MRLLNVKFAGVLLSLLMAAVTSRAALGTISATVSPAGGVLLGDQLTVTLRVASYADPSQIDGYNFTVGYPTGLFSFVPGPFDSGTVSGPDQQWLSESNQESALAGYDLTDFNDGVTTPGTVYISMLDSGFSEPENGTVGNSGFLVSFKLQSIAKGTGNIMPAAFEGGTGLFDTGLVSVGVPSFSGATVTVSAVGPTLSVAQSGSDVVISWPSPSTGFSLQYSSGLPPVIIWQSVTNAVVVTNSQNTVTIPITTDKYFRLICPSP
jgi:hypothetical protein